MFDSIPLLFRAFESSIAIMSVVWSAVLHFNIIIVKHVSKVHAYTQSGLSSTHSCICVDTSHHLLFPLNPATIHSDLKKQATNIAALKQVFLTKKWRQQNVVTYDTVGDIKALRHAGIMSSHFNFKHNTWYIHSLIQLFCRLRKNYRNNISSLIHKADYFTTHFN